MGILFAAIIAVGSWLHLPGGSWQPSAEQVAEAKRLLEPYVRDQAKERGEDLDVWESYTFQYQGRVWDGKQVLYINSFCTEPPSNAATQEVFVLDGGACYFGAYWDPESKRFLQFWFNGHA